MRRHTAAIVWAGPGRVFAPGRVVSGPDGRIVAVESHRGRVQHRAIVPGLVNAHAHAQLEPLKRQVREFVPWLRAVMRQRRSAETGDQASVAARHFESWIAEGCTAVGEIDSTGESPAAVRRTGIAGRCFQEIVGFDVDGRGARHVLRERARSGSPRCPRGLSPHAPYSVSGALLRASQRASRVLQVHVAESEEEVEFLASRCGPFRDLLEELGKLPPRAGWAPTTGVRWLAAHGALRRTTSLVHCQHLGADDLQRIRRSGASIVSCPGTVRYFRRPAPPLQTWLDAGVPVGLGTDSHASNADGSMLGELRQARLVWPNVDPAEFLRMATAGGARALARPALGGLRAGAAADYMAVSWAGDVTVDAMVDAMTSARATVDCVWLRGERWKRPKFRSQGHPAGDLAVVTR